MNQKILALSAWLYNELALLKSLSLKFTRGMAYFDFNDYLVNGIKYHALRELGKIFSALRLSVRVIIPGSKSGSYVLAFKAYGNSEFKMGYGIRFDGFKFHEPGPVIITNDDALLLCCVEDGPLSLFNALALCRHPLYFKDDHTWCNQAVYNLFSRRIGTSSTKGTLPVFIDESQSHLCSLGFDRTGSDPSHESDQLWETIQRFRQRLAGLPTPNQRVLEYVTVMISKDDSHVALAFRLAGETLVVQSGTTPGVFYPDDPAAFKNGADEFQVPWLIYGAGTSPKAPVAPQFTYMSKFW